MGPKNEQHPIERVDAQASKVNPINGDEEQASAGAPDPAQGAERASQQTINTSPRLSSDQSSDVLFDSGSAGSGGSSSRKTPFHRRIAKTFNRPKGRSKIPFVRKSFGPHVSQTIRSLDVYPQGYGKLAAIEACDPNLLIYRKFSWLHNRLLLHYQDEIAELEKELEQFDTLQFRQAPNRLISRRRDDIQPDAERKNLLKTIDEKLAQYHSLLLRMQKIHAIKRPTSRNQSSLWHLITNTQSQTSQEAEWIHLGPDLAALAHDQEYGKFNTFLETFLNRVSQPLTKIIFRSREQKITTGSEEIDLLSPTRIDILLRIVLTILAAALLLFPVLILYKNQPTSLSELQQKGKVQILTVFAFTLLFSACCSIVTKARRQEVFAATAAYCAVLVVFLGNTSNVMVTAVDRS